MIRQILKYKPTQSIESEVLEHRQKIQLLEDQRGFMFIKQMYHCTPEGSILGVSRGGFPYQQ